MREKQIAGEDAVLCGWGGVGVACWVGGWGLGCLCGGCPGGKSEEKGGGWGGRSYRGLERESGSSERGSSPLPLSLERGVVISEREIACKRSLALPQSSWLAICMLKF